jgi:hypothetical protein
MVALWILNKHTMELWMQVTVTASEIQFICFIFQVQDQLLWNIKKDRRSHIFVQDEYKQLNLFSQKKINNISYITCILTFIINYQENNSNLKYRCKLLFFFSVLETSDQFRSILPVQGYVIVHQQASSKAKVPHVDLEQFYDFWIYPKCTL